MKDTTPIQDSPIEILLSLRDAAYESIKSGTKTYEFRRRWRSSPCIAYIYRSGKCRRLSAYMKLGAPIFGSPHEMGRLAEGMSRGNGAAVEEYFIPTKGGFAIPIEGFYEFPSLSLPELRGLGFHPPQYFSYLSRYPKLKRKLQERVEVDSEPFNCKKPKLQD